MHFPALVGITPGLRVLVAGGTGTVGSGVVLSLLKQGARVVVATRSLEKFEVLKDAAPEKFKDKLSVAQGDVSTEEGVQNVFDTAASKQDGGVQHVVASLGSWWQKGRLIDQPLEEIDEVLKDRATGNFLLFRTFIPYLNRRKGHTYTIVTGNAGSRYIAPGVSLLCMSSGALHGMATAAVAEHKESNVAVCHFKIHCRVQPKNDSDIPDNDPFNVGNDVMGAAIVASMVQSSRDQVNMYNRQEVRDFANIKRDTGKTVQ